MRAAVRWLRSLRFAYEGIKYALATQPNMKFHFFASFLALISALYFKLSKLDILFILLAVSLVIVTELVNTAVEKTVDLAMPDRHPLAKIAKDTAAAAVLVSAVFAAIVGMTVFYGPVVAWFRRLAAPGHDVSAPAALVYLALVALTVIVTETRFSRNAAVRPSIWMAASFTLSTLIALLSAQALAAVLAYSLSLLFLVHMYRRRSRTLPMLLFGAAIGIAVTLLVYYMDILNRLL